MRLGKECYTYIELDTFNFVFDRTSEVLQAVVWAEVTSSMRHYDCPSDFVRFWLFLRGLVSDFRSPCSLCELLNLRLVRPRKLHVLSVAGLDSSCDCPAGSNWYCHEIVFA